MRVVPILATLLLVLGSTLGIAACAAGGGGGASDLGAVPTTIVVSTTQAADVVPEPATPGTVLPDYASLVARANVVKLAVYAQPGDEQPLREFTQPVASAPGVRVGQVFLVVSQRDDGWVNVMLPVQPAGSTAWVHDTDVTITQVAYRLRVEMGAGRLTVFRRGRESEHVAITIDAAARGTKPGHYFLRASSTAPASRMTASPFVYVLIPKLASTVPLGTPVDVAS
jgi:hypothetical protein